MSLPAPVRESVTEVTGPFEVFGPVGGGCIQPAFRLATAKGPAFLKYSDDGLPDLFAVEAEGLGRLAAATSALRVPQVLAFHDGAGSADPGWLLLEWIEQGSPGRDFGERLAQGLAEIHAPGPDGWGWERDGFIGSLAQDNERSATWPEFWWSRRLAPRLDLAREAGMLPGTEAEWELLLGQLPEALSDGDVEGPSLLHGDLWSGNILATQQGEPVLIDPAPYRGHREVDLAMLDLFGSPGGGFERAYSALCPLRDGYRELRRGIYQLYYLLVHVNLFGHGYLSRTTATLRAVLAA